MAYDYDELFRETPNALGEPTKALVDFFEGYQNTGARVLDVGCGQGRDALFIARLGHRVVGVDLSPAGVADLLAQSAREGLSIVGHVADIRTYRPDGMFDVIVIDRTLHMLCESDRLSVLVDLIDHLAPDGHVLIADEPSNLPGFRQVLTGAGAIWSMIRDERGLLFVRRME